MIMKDEKDEIQERHRLLKRKGANERNNIRGKDKKIYHLI
jgi:hypothetical protein